MNWFPIVVFYIGTFDAVVTMLGGLLAAFVVLMGWDARAMWDRLFPAGLAVVISNLAAAFILAAVHWLGAHP